MIEEILDVLICHEGKKAVKIVIKMISMMPLEMTMRTIMKNVGM